MRRPPALTPRRCQSQPTCAIVGWGKLTVGGCVAQESAFTPSIWPTVKNVVRVCGSYAVAQAAHAGVNATAYFGCASSRQSRSCSARAPTWSSMHRAAIGWAMVPPSKMS